MYAIHCFLLSAIVLVQTWGVGTLINEILVSILEMAFWMANFQTDDWAHTLEEHSQCPRSSKVDSAQAN